MRGESNASCARAPRISAQRRGSAAGARARAEARQRPGRRAAGGRLRAAGGGLALRHSEVSPGGGVRYLASIARFSSSGNGTMSPRSVMHPCAGEGRYSGGGAARVIPPGRVGAF